MCAPSPPPAPDYEAQAKAQGAANVETARVQGKMNNPNLVNPYGTQTVEWGTPDAPDVFDETGYNAALTKWNAPDPNSGVGRWESDGEGSPQRWVVESAGPPPNRADFITKGEKGVGIADQPTITQKFSPEQQALYDQQNQIAKKLGLLGVGGLDWLQKTVDKPLDVSGAPERLSGPDASAFSMTDQINKSGIPGLQTSLSGGPIQTQMGDVGSQQTAFGSAGPIQGQMGYTGSQRTTLGPTGSIQNQYDYSKASAMPGADESTRKSVVDSIMARQQPGMKQQEDELNTQLITRGFRPGTEAWNREWQRLGAQQNDMRLAADVAGGQEMQRVFGMGMQSRQQGIGEAQSQGNFNNSAQQQGYAQELGRGVFENSAQGQNFAQEAQRMASSNAAQQQGFGQERERGTFANTAQAGNFAQEGARMGANNQAQAQGFGQNATAGEFNNRAQGQAYQQATSDAAFKNTATGQNFNQGMAGAEFAGKNRNNAIAEALLLRQLPLQELNALRTGAQPNMPNFPGYQGSNIAPPPIYGAAKDASAYQTDVFNAETASSNATTSAVAGLGVAALAAFF